MAMLAIKATVAEAPVIAVGVRYKLVRSSKPNRESGPSGDVMQMAQN
jgi:hypothetical protein